MIVSNKEGRLADIRSLAEELCSEGACSSSKLASLKGRLLYAAGHTMGLAVGHPTDRYRSQRAR